MLLIVDHEINNDVVLINLVGDEDVNESQARNVASEGR